MSGTDADNSKPFTMTDLGETLKGPDANLVAVAILSRLDRLEDEIEMFKRSGPSPSDYAQVEIVRVAIVAAREIVLSTLTASGTVRH